MGKPTVVIADTDEKYLAPLELKFAEELYARIELEIISDRGYYGEYFSAPKSVKTLIVSEQLYDESLQRHDIGKIFILTEEPVNEEQAPSEDPGQCRKIFKYSSTLEIFNEITFESQKDFFQSEQSPAETQVILFCSAGGGAGKTTVALGTAACLASNHKKVFYLSAEYFHTFHRYLTDKSYVPNGFYKELNPEDKQIYGSIKHYFRNERFDYMPPFSVSLPSLNIDFGIYKTLIESMRAAGEYNYIIVDIDSALNVEKMDLFSIADKVIILLNQDSYSVFKTEMFMNSVSVNDKEKNLFVCNKFQSDRENAVLSEHTQDRLIVSEYIEYIDEMNSITVSGLANIKGFQKMAFLLI
jgi:cellulose biosynthesis protein BcsQ